MDVNGTAAVHPEWTPDAMVVKGRAIGRWREILINVAGIPAELLDSREHPCFKCGGTTRLRLLDEEAGAIRCSHCFAEKCGDGIAAVGWARGVDFKESLRLIGDYLGIRAPH